MEDPTATTDHPIETPTGPDHWTRAPLVALDLEGTGPQDRDHEAILEVALIPIVAGRPDTDSLFSTVINPGRPVQRRPWISPGLTHSALAGAPRLEQVEPELARRLDGRILVGHNIGVDWRLLHRRCPGIRITGLIDTLRLARFLHRPSTGFGLSALVDRYRLADRVTVLAPGSQPHRAAWDAVAAALLLGALIDQLPQGSSLCSADLVGIAGVPTDSAVAPAGPAAVIQSALFDTAPDSP